MRLIDADALRSKFLKKTDLNKPNIYNYILTIRCINDAPTVEPETVRHSTWGHLEHGALYSAKCNLCGNWGYAPAFYENLPLLEYCPNCGAKMDE